MQISTNVGFGTRVFPAVKLGTYHFPVGTIFRTVVDSCLGERSGKEYEVKSIIRNDIRSFVLVTTTFDHDLGMNIGLNIRHVDKVIKRGSGCVDIQDIGSSNEENENHIQYILDRIQHFRDFVVSTGVKVRKNEYVFSRFDTSIVVWLFGQERVDCALNSNVIWKHMDKSSVFKKTFISQYDDECLIVKKKAFKKWLKQNINRLYVSLDKLQKEQDMFEQAMLDQELDMDDDMGRDYGPTDIQSNNQKRIDDLVEKAWADEVFKELNETLANIDNVLSQEQPTLDVKVKKHEEDF